MRILHVLDNSNLGGIQSMIFSLYKMSKHEHGFWAGEGSMAQELRAAGMKLWTGAPPPEENYEIMLGHTVGGWSYHDTSGWAHDRGMKVVEVMHSPAASPTPPEDLDGFIGVSSGALNPNRNMPKAVCIYPPLAVNEFNPDVHGPAIGRLSRLVDEKRPQDFVEVAKYFPDEEFLLAGDGVLFESLRQGAPSNVKMVGWIRDFPDFYSKLKLFVFPSRDECCSMSVARAQVAGLPVICQDTAALRETTGGYAVYAGSVPDFVDQVRNFLSDPVAFSDLAENGHGWAKMAFNSIASWDEYVERLK